MVGTLARSNIVEIHNNYAVGIDLYAHSDEEFRAQYLNLVKSVERKQLRLSYVHAL
jgi:hypothetical protein